MNDTPKLKIPDSLRNDHIHCFELTDPKLIERFGAKEIIFIPSYAKVQYGAEFDSSFQSRIFIPNDNVTFQDIDLVEQWCREESQEYDEENDVGKCWNY